VAPETQLSISEFARRTRLSLKALRLYDQLGLLKPAEVASNGYRIYRESQLETARLVLLLRRLDMPLDVVKDVVSAPTNDAAAALIASYWDGVERRVADQRELAAYLGGKVAGEPTRHAAYEVFEREAPERLVLTELRHVRIQEMETWFDAAHPELMRRAESYGGLAGAPYRIFHGAVSEDSDGPVELCVPVAGGAGDAAVQHVPAQREAYVRVKRSQFEFPQILSAYEAVERWMREEERPCAGPPREIYVAGLGYATARPDEIVCEVAFPIA
jgi:DNA-binding transcriptional MerR regulator